MLLTYRHTPTCHCLTSHIEDVYYSVKVCWISYFVSKSLRFFLHFVFFFSAPSYLLEFFLTENMKFIQCGLIHKRWLMYIYRLRVKIFYGPKSPFLHVKGLIVWQGVIRTSWKPPLKRWEVFLGGRVGYSNEPMKKRMSFAVTEEIMCVAAIRDSIAREITWAEDIVKNRHTNS